MTIRFFPTLQQIAYVKIAQGIIYRLNIEKVKKSFLPIGSRPRIEFIQRIEKMVSTIVDPTFPVENVGVSSVPPIKSDRENNSVLPSEVQTQLVGIVMALRSEIKNWYKHHSSILRHNNLDLRNRLAWYSFGIINRFDTARCFIEDESINIEERFNLACKYYAKDNMHMLWKTLSTEDKSSFKRYLPPTISAEIWIAALESDTKIDWSYVEQNATKKIFLSYYFRLHYIFRRTRGSQNKSLLILKSLKKGILHNFDLYLCLSQMKEYELNKMLHHCPEVELHKIIERFLEWPFQVIFLNVFNDCSRHIYKETFCELLICILFFKIRVGCKDYLYTKLLECFWNIVTEDYRDFVKDDEKLYTILLYALENNCLDMEVYTCLLNNYIEE